MAKVEPFEKFTLDYENWFERNDKLYLSELKLLKDLIKEEHYKNSVEVGVGSGRFAQPLGVKYGVDPSMAMLKIALQRGIKVVKGIAEELPLKSSLFEFVLTVTTICFVDDIAKTFKEIERILKPKGFLVVGFVDRSSFLGQLYEKKKPYSKFYKPATFYSTEEVIQIAHKYTSLKLERVKQTIFGIENKIYPAKEGWGEGAFVGLLFRKPL